MFQKLVLSLLMSPSLIVEVEKYENKLKKDLLWQKIGIIFSVVIFILSNVTIYFPQKHIFHTTPEINSVAADGFRLEKSVANLTTGANLTTNPIKASENDIISYTLSATNLLTHTEKFTFVDNISDLLEYGDIYRLNGGQIKDNSIFWPETQINSGESAERSFSIKIKSKLPLSARNPNTPTSFDCKLTNNFGNFTQVYLSCPPLKYVENFTSYLFNIDAIFTILFISIILIVQIILFIRTKILLKEIKFIRQNYTTGAF